MKPNRARDLEILTAIGEGAPLTQRALSERLGVALGLTNLYLKRLAHKGYIKIVEFPKKPAARKRLRYLVTPKGLAEKGRLTYEHMAYALNLDRKSTRLNSSHLVISYAVFCLKKKTSLMSPAAGVAGEGGRGHPRACT